MTSERSNHNNPATGPKRENAQGEHEGVPHKPEEFDTVNPAKQKDIRQDSDKSVIPGGHELDTAKREDKDRPGVVDKTEDC